MKPLAVPWKSGARGAGSALHSLISDKLIVAFCTLVVLTIIVAWAALPKAVSLAPGQLAKSDIEAPRTVINRSATDKIREEARKDYVKNAPNVMSNYEINQAYSYMAEDAVEAAFSAVEQARAERGANAPADEVGKAAERIAKATGGLALGAEEFTLLAQIPRADFDAAKSIAVSLTGNTMRKLRITETSVQAVEAGIPDDLLRSGLAAGHIRGISRVVVAAIHPNLSLDMAKVERAAEERATSVEPVYIHKGQIIIRRGDIATQEQVDMLGDLGLLGARVSVLGWIGVVGSVALCFGYVAAYSRAFPRRMGMSANVLALIAVACVVVLLVAGLLANLAPVMASHLVPTAFATMVIAALVSLEAALTVNIPLSLLVGAVLKGGSFAVAASLAAGAAGAYSVSGLKDRATMSRAAVYVGGSLCAVSLVFGLVFNDAQVLSVWYMGIANGIISTVMTLGSLPFFEALFGMTSPMRLLELSNPGHPLLKRLLLEAPGTYHHSILVGNLAETAAQAVGADGLLVRAGALYHDVGKLKRPYFFVENQFAQGNPHDKISPSLSTLVITSHAKDGVELAKAHRLPQPVVDIIQQHHGTGLVSYFYHRASEGSPDQPVAEENFRYPGPNPQSAEAAIVMLADSVEAAVRAMQETSPWQVKNVVRKVIWGKLNDGQLDQCNLTLRDLNNIENAFLGVLSGIYHERIEYPSLTPRPNGDGEGDAADASGNNQPAGPSSSERRSDTAGGAGGDGRS